MTARRSRGDGGLHWDELRQRWIATVTVGYAPSGKRIVKRTSGRTKTEARTKLKELVRDHDDGLAVAPHGYTVADAVNDWLDYGLTGRDPSTVENRRILARHHVIPALGARKLRDLSAEDVDRWLAHRARVLSTSTLQSVKSILRRSIARAQARDKVKRNVVLLCGTPKGQVGRPSKALTLDQAHAMVDSATRSTMGAYVLVSLLTGARPEELRALTWSHIDLDGAPAADPPVLPHARVWRSVRAGGDTKTRTSRRTVALPQRCVDALREHRQRQDAARRLAGDRWVDLDLVFASEVGTTLAPPWTRPTSAATSAGSPPRPGSTRSNGRPESCGTASCPCCPTRACRSSRSPAWSGTQAGRPSLETVYRKQLRPVIEDGATVMDRVFGVRGRSHSDSHPARPGTPRRPSPNPLLGL